MQELDALKEPIIITSAVSLGTTAVTVVTSCRDARSES